MQWEIVSTDVVRQRTCCALAVRRFIDYRAKSGAYSNGLRMQVYLEEDVQA